VARVVAPPAGCFTTDPTRDGAQSSGAVADRSTGPRQHMTRQQQGSPGAFSIAHVPSAALALSPCLHRTPGVWPPERTLSPSSQRS